MFFFLPLYDDNPIGRSPVVTYALIGLFFNAPRLTIAGAVVAALTLGGYFYLPSHFMLWMAVVGGGSLILAGVWMRQV